jgi:alginate O-acetyltransferase complex protein AlgI
MQLLSIQYLAFVAILFVLYYTVFRRIQWVCLLIGSIAFYVSYGPKSLIYILITSFSVWLGALVMEKFQTACNIARKQEGITKEQKKKLKNKCQKKKRAVLIALLLLNFGILGYFKYWNDILDAIVGIGHVGSGSVYSVYHISGLLLPLGISFYTFQSIGYLVDVYNKKSKPSANFLKFLTFVSFFPQMLQGPINRFDQMAEQLYERHHLDLERCGRALLLFLFGAMKKYVIAEMLVGKIGAIFDGPVDNLSSPMIILGILMYSAQLYGDFSGGIDMVMAVAQLFGIRMMQNFRQPYFSVSLGDFWRRWHISLGAWMRDYIFYPFALTKPMQRFAKFCGRHLNKHLGRVLPAAIANILVFFVVGVWHGFYSNFILWGLYNGIVIAVSDILQPVFQKWNEVLHINTQSRGMYVWRVIRTFIIVNIGWYFDRIEKFSSVWICFRNTITRPDWTLLTVRYFMRSQFGKMPLIPVVVVLALVVVFINSVLQERGVDVYAKLHARRPAVRWTLYLFLAIMTLFAVSYSNGSGGFLYANF